MPGGIPRVLELQTQRYITTTIFVKYRYSQNDQGEKTLHSITVAGIPNGFLQDRYNPDANNGIWSVGPDAPTRDEEFRTRLHLPSLENVAAWRVQTIPMGQAEYVWRD
jgi:hypothetical protein